MKRDVMLRFRRWSFATAICALLFPFRAVTEPIDVHYMEGAVHGFLVLRTQEGHTLAVGDLIQTVHGSRVTSRLVFRFRDGSIDDETTVFSQRGHFQLIADHHIQKGPSYPHPMDVAIDVARGLITVRSIEKNGKEKVATEHMDLPPDLANGMLFMIVKNIRPDSPETKVSMVLATPKPRLVKLAISPHGEESFSLAGSPRKAVRFVVKVELGGVAGVVAPLIGKAPPDTQFWILGGKPPAIVREEGPLFQGGGIWSVQLTSPVWPRRSDGGF